MKKTLIITMEYPPQIGGIATYVHSLARALDPEKTIVLAPPHPDAEAWDSAQKYTVIRKPFLYPKFIWPRWTRLRGEVRRLVKREGIERIMVHHVLPVGYAGIKMKKKGVPFLLFSHGTDLVAGTKTAHKKRMVSMVARHADQIVFNSESLKQRFLTVLPDFADKSVVMYPCPDEEYMLPPDQKEIEKLRAMYALHGKKTLLTVSRFAEGKGFPHLIRMMPEILKRHPHLVWLLIGDGPKKTEIVKMIQEHNLQNIVRFIGDVPHQDLKKFYHTADLFVLLTHPDNGREEGLGLVFLEAAAAGLPVVAGRSGGVEEAVIDGETGLVIDLADGDELVITSIVALLENKEAAEHLGQQAQERIRAEFQWNEQLKCIQEWLA